MWKNKKWKRKYENVIFKKKFKEKKKKILIARKENSILFLYKFVQSKFIFFSWIWIGWNKFFFLLYNFLRFFLVLFSLRIRIFISCEAKKKKKNNFEIFVFFWIGGIQKKNSFWSPLWIESMLLVFV